MPRGHRRVVYTQNGKARIPGRFAIDFIKLDDKGRYASKDENNIQNWYGYDTAVLAVMDGVVFGLKNDFNESSTLSGHPKYGAEKATGNYISVTIGDDKYVFYEHLKPGTIRVKMGQRIKKGDVLGAVGFTGQSTGPHLHLHVADKNFPLGAEGIPFVFEKFDHLGAYDKISEKWNDGDPSKTIMNERPSPNSVIRFVY